MKVNRIHRIMAAVLAAVVVLGTIGFGTGEAQAASNDFLTLFDVMWVGQDDVFDVITDVYTEGSSGEYTMTKATSSNPSVLKVRLSKEGGEVTGIARAKKTGKTTVKVTYKDSKGNEKTISQKIRVKKYPKAIQSLKVNGKKVTISKNKYYFDKKCKTTKPSIRMSLKKGWKVVSVTAFAYKGTKEKPINISKSAVKKGTKFSFPKKYKEMYVRVILENKSHETFIYDIAFYR